MNKRKTKESTPIDEPVVFAYTPGSYTIDDFNNFIKEWERTAPERAAQRNNRMRQMLINSHAAFQAAYPDQAGTTEESLKSIADATRGLSKP